MTTSPESSGVMPMPAATRIRTVVEYCKSAEIEALNKCRDYSVWLTI